MRRVNKKEIDRIYRFTRAHFVEYYDLQTELVDHLATGIEKNWEKEPDLDFEKNLQREFKKFGVFGFSDIVAQRQAAMDAKYRRLILREIKAQFRKLQVWLPMVFGIIGLTYLFQWEIAYILLFFVLLLQSTSVIAMVFARKRRIKQKKRIYLFEQTLITGSGYIFAFYIPLILLNLLSPLENLLDGSHFYFNLLAAVILTLEVFITYIGVILLPAKKEALLNELHPERKLG